MRVLNWFLLTAVAFMACHKISQKAGSDPNMALKQGLINQSYLKVVRESGEVKACFEVVGDSPEAKDDAVVQKTRAEVRSWMMSAVGTWTDALVGYNEWPHAKVTLNMDDAKCGNESNVVKVKVAFNEKDFRRAFSGEWSVVSRSGCQTFSDVSRRLIGLCYPNTKDGVGLDLVMSRFGGILGVADTYFEEGRFNGARDQPGSVMKGNRAVLANDDIQSIRAVWDRLSGKNGHWMGPSCPTGYRERENLGWLMYGRLYCVPNDEGADCPKGMYCGPFTDEERELCHKYSKEGNAACNSDRWDLAWWESIHSHANCPEGYYCSAFTEEQRELCRKKAKDPEVCSEDRWELKIWKSVSGAMKSEK